MDDVFYRFLQVIVLVELLENVIFLDYIFC